MYISRSVEPLIRQNLFQGKVIILYGARQTGKTTLTTNLRSTLNVPTAYLNCDEGDIRLQLTNATTSTQLKQLIGDDRLVIIDEAQRVPDIGIKLKLLIDTYPQQQIIATGSSSFELSNTIVEPLTGRNLQFFLHPLSYSEIRGAIDSRTVERMRESMLIYGNYPAVIQAESTEKKKIVIAHIVADYAYKDILKLTVIRKTDTVEKLLQALALQIGNEVSYTELARLLGVSKQLIESYITILEQAFIIFRLTPYAKNARKALSKLRKIYFWDTGIRNALIHNFNPLALRVDSGVLWENFIIAEWKKKARWLPEQSNLHFWRTYDGQEVDLVEESAGRLSGYEIKWDDNHRNKPPHAWRVGYPTSSWNVITTHNYQHFIQPEWEIVANNK